MSSDKNKLLFHSRLPSSIALTDFSPSAVGGEGPLPRAIPIPDYLERIYWWAYVRPWAIRIFERRWLVNLILFGNYRRLIDAALDAFGGKLCGRTLQVACVYGDLTSHVSRHVVPGGALDVVDVVPAQLDNLRRKLPAAAPVSLIHRDSASLGFADASYDQVLLYMLLHEQPERVRRRTLAEVVRVVRPGGRIVVIDYHRPARWHPLRGFLRFILDTLEPFAPDLWKNEISDYLPPGSPISDLSKTTFFGGMYQRVVMVRGSKR
ncbi:MAG: rhodoquinone biosynthesis methyltransferase RquA [Betaproteobacteria bacterium]|nr:rhodoquinone biosynthesis methyltransferase RquA [Betaproteobacteria bacterium]